MKRAARGAAQIGSDVSARSMLVQQRPRVKANLATSMLILAETFPGMLRSPPTEQMRSANAVVRDLYFGGHDRRIWVVCARTDRPAYSNFLRSTAVCAPSNAFPGERRRRRNLARPASRPSRYGNTIEI